MVNFLGGIPPFAPSPVPCVRGRASLSSMTTLVWLLSSSHHAGCLTYIMGVCERDSRPNIKASALIAKRGSDELNCPHNAANDDGICFCFFIPQQHTHTHTRCWSVWAWAAHCDWLFLLSIWACYPGLGPRWHARALSSHTHSQPCRLHPYRYTSLNAFF